MESGDYLSSWLDVLRDTSLDKWRPVNNAFLFVAVNLFGNSYPAFWMLNTALIASLGIVVIWFFHTLGFGESLHQRTLIALATLVILTSPMTFFARQGIFGFLELAPLILAIISYRFFLRPNHSNALEWSALCAALAFLIHERYLVLTVGLAVFAYLRSKTDSRYQRTALRFLLLPAIWAYTMIFALGANPLRGGGEVPLDESVGRWILGRLFDAAVLLSGASFGTTVSMDPEGFTSLILGPETYFGAPTRLWATCIALGILLPTVGSVVVNRFRTISAVLPSVRLESGYAPRRIVQELVLTSGLLLVPAATVVSRIEMRWLFGSLLFGILALTVGQLARPSVNRYARSGFITLTLLLAVNAVGWSHHSHYNMFRTNTYSLIEHIQAATTDRDGQSYWVHVKTDRFLSYVDWSTNRGRALLQGEVREVVFNADDPTEWLNSCQSLENRTCVEVSVSATRFGGSAAIVVTKR